MKTLTIVLAIALAVAVIRAQSQRIDLSTQSMIDLSHGYGPSTVFWPTSPIRFVLKKLAFGKTDAGYFYAATSFCMPEHGGTHLDAPLHFSESGRPADQVPLEQLIASAVVIDVTARAAADRDYRATAEDVLQFEKTNGKVSRMRLDSGGGYNFLTPQQPSSQ